MKVVTYTYYGKPEVLKIEDLDKPTPKDDEVLVRVHTSSVNIAEWYGITGLFIGAQPRVFWPGKVKPFVEKTYPLTRIAEAMRHLGTGHAKVKIVVTMGVNGKR